MHGVASCSSAGCETLNCRDVREPRGPEQNMNPSVDSSKSSWMPAPSKEVGQDADSSKLDGEPSVARCFVGVEVEDALTDAGSFPLGVEGEAGPAGPGTSPTAADSAASWSAVAPAGAQVVDEFFSPVVAGAGVVSAGCGSVPSKPSR